MIVLDRDPSLIIDSSPRYNLGELILRPGTGEIYQYVKNGGADTTVATKLACNKAAATRGVKTMTQADVTSGTLGTITRACGIWQAAIPLNYYGVLLVVSDYADVFTDGGVVDGDYLVVNGGATEDFLADTAVAGEEHGVFGVALADDVSTNVKARVNFL